MSNNTITVRKVDNIITGTSSSSGDPGTLPPDTAEVYYRSLTDVEFNQVKSVRQTMRENGVGSNPIWDDIQRIAVAPVDERPYIRLSIAEEFSNNATTSLLSDGVDGIRMRFQTLNIDNSLNTGFQQRIPFEMTTGEILDLNFVDGEIIHLYRTTVSRMINFDSNEIIKFEAPVELMAVVPNA